MALTSTITAKIAATQTAASDLGTSSFPLAYSESNSLANGTAASQADLLFSDTRTLSASGTEDLDLSGSLSDAFGNTLAFVKVKSILIVASSDNTNDVQVEPAAANGFLGPFAAVGDQLDIPPGGSIMLNAPVNGWTVTAGSGDLLTITNSAGTTSVEYDIVIVGTSA